PSARCRPTSINEGAAATVSDSATSSTTRMAQRAPEASASITLARASRVSIRGASRAIRSSTGAWPPRWPSAPGPRWPGGAAAVEPPPADGRVVEQVVGQGLDVAPGPVGGQEPEAEAGPPGQAGQGLAEGGPGAA